MLQWTAKVQKRGWNKRHLCWRATKHAISATQMRLGALLQTWLNPVFQRQVLLRREKTSADRSAVLLCVDSDARDKQVLVPIGTSPKSCLKNIKKKLPAKYHANNKSWITADVFSAFMCRYGREKQESLCCVSKIDRHFCLWNVKVIPGKLYKCAPASLVER